MHMKSLARVSVLALLLAVPVWTLTAAAPADGKEVVIRAISAWPLSIDGNTWYKNYIKEVNKRGKGVVQIRLLGGNEVASAFEQFQALRTGIADMTNSAPAYYVGETVEAAAVSLIAPKSLQGFLDGLRKSGALDIINKAYREKSSMRFLGITVAGTGFRFLMATPIKDLDGIKGKRIRASGAQDAAAIQYLGGSPQTLPANELYTALQRGVVDGAYRAPNDAWSFGEHKVYKAMIATPIQFAPGGVYMPTGKWDKLPDNVKKVLEGTIVDMEPDDPQVLPDQRQRGDQAAREERHEGDRGGRRRQEAARRSPQRLLARAAQAISQVRRADPEGAGALQLIPAVRN